MVSQRLALFCSSLIISSEIVNVFQIVFSVGWFVAKQDQDRYHDIAVFCMVSAANAFIQILYYLYQSYKNRSFLVVYHSVGPINGVMIMLHMIPLIWGGIVLAWNTDSPIPMFAYVWPYIHAAVCTFVWSFSRERSHEFTNDNPYFRV